MHTGTLILFITMLCVPPCIEKHLLGITPNGFLKQKRARSLRDLVSLVGKTSCDYVYASLVVWCDFFKEVG